MVTEFITNENVYPEQDKLLFSYSNKSYKLEYSINVDTTQGQLSEIEGYNGELTIYRAHKVTVDLELFLDNASLWKKTVGISDLFGEHSYEGYDIVSETVTDNTLLVNEDFFKEWLMTTVRVSQALGEIYIHFEFTRNPEMMDEIWEITPAFTTDGQSVIRVESHDTFN